MTPERKGHQAYLNAIERRAKALEAREPGTYDAHYWRIEFETGGTLTSAQIHKRANEAARRSGKRHFRDGA